jgi:hypothetical protein
VIHHIYPQIDSTLYEGTSSLNSGLDEILEIRKVIKSGSANTVSRIVTKFDITSISQSVSAGTIPSNAKYYLVLSAMDAEEVPLDYTIEAWPVSQSWTNGTGRRFNNPITTDGVAWLYRTDTETWSTGSAVVANSTSSYQKNAGGGTWYVNATSSYGTSMVFTSIEMNDLFYVTSSGGTVYTFTPSGSTETSSSFTNDNPATASIAITDFSQNNSYVVSASISASFIYVDDPYLFDDISSANVYYFSNSGSQTGVGASASIEITNGDEGNQYTIYDGLTYTLIASDSPVPPDVPSARVYYFLSSTSSMASTAASMSVEINAISGLNVTASYSASILQLTGSDYSVTGNDYTFTSGSTTVTFAGGHKNDITSSITGLVNEINSVSGIGLTATASAQTLILSASDLGIIGNTYSFISGSTTTNLQGGYTSSVVSSSYTLASDNTTTNTYYFITGSSLSGSLYNLSEKINDITAFISTVTASNTLHVTGSGNAANQQLVGIQSGSTQQLLTTPVNKLLISGSQRFNYASADTRMDVSNMVYEWLNGNITNDGIIVKLPNADEQSNVSFDSLKFFSVDTHTIYIPKLRVAWDDQTFVTGSLTELTANNIQVHIKGLKKNFKADSKVKLRIHGREKYPVRTFATSSNYLDVKYLPTSSYWSVRDTVTEEVIIPFDDNYTKISTDAEGNYFTFWTSGFQPERYYRFVFKLVRDGQEEYFDEGYYFKVVR